MADPSTRDVIDKTLGSKKNYPAVSKKPFITVDENERIKQGLQSVLGGIYEDDDIDEIAQTWQDDDFDAGLEIIVEAERLPFWKRFKGLPKFQKDAIRQELKDTVAELPPSFNPFKRLSDSEKLAEAMEIVSKRYDKKYSLLTIDPESANIKRIQSAGFPSLFADKDLTEAQKLYQKFQTNAQDMSKDELAKFETNIDQMYLAGTITEKDFNKIQLSLNKLNNPMYRLDDAKFYKDDALYKKREDLIGPREKLYNIYYSQAKRKYENERERIERSLVIGNALEQKAEPTENDVNNEIVRLSRLDAIGKIKPYKWALTSEFYDSPKAVGISRIVDPELGLIEDKDTGKLRKATTAELATQIPLRQRLSRPRERDTDTALQIYLNQIKEKPLLGDPRLSLFAQKQGISKIVNNKRTQEYIKQNILNDLNFVDGDLSRLKKEYPESYDKYIDINKSISVESETKKQKALLKTPRQRLLSRSSDALNWTFQTDTLDGFIVETPFAAGLRTLFNFVPGGAAAIALDALPGVDKTKIKSPKDITLVKGYDQPVITHKSNVVAQAVVNWLTFQGMPETFRASGIADVIGDTPAFAMGIIPELGMPLSGFPTVLKGAAKAGQLVSGAIEQAGKTHWVLKPIEMTGRASRIVTTPLESAKMRNMFNSVEDVLEGGGKKAYAKLNNKWNFKNDWASLWDKELRRSTFAKETGDLLGDRIATPFILKELMGMNKSNIQKLTDIQKLAHNNDYVDGLLSQVSGLKTVDEKINFIKDKLLTDTISIKKLSRSKKAPLLNQVLEIAESQAKIFKNQNKLLDKNASDQMLQEIYNINPDVLYEHFKVRLTELYKTNQIDDQALFDISRRIAKLPAKDRTQENLQKLIPEFDDAYIVSDMVSNIFATSRSISKRVERGLADVAPFKMVLMGNDTGVRPANITKERKAEFVKEWDYLITNNAVMKTVDGKSVWQMQYPNELMEALIEELGTKRVRTEFWLDAFKSIDKGEVTLSQMTLINRAIQDKLAKKHFKGVELTEFGEQAFRAKNPMEDTFFPSTLLGGKKAKGSPDYTPSGILQTTKDVAQTIPILKNIIKKNPVAKPVNPTRLKVAIDEINSMAPKIYNQFLNDVQLAITKKTNERFKETGIKPNKKERDQLKMQALDQVFNDSWKIVADKKIESIERVVQRSFNGDYKKYANAIIQSTEKEVAGSPFTNIQIRFKKAKERGETIDNEWWKSQVIDSELYLPKLDIWQRLLKMYYQANPKALDLIDSKLINRLIKKGALGKQFKTAKEEAKGTESLASNTIDPNPTMFRALLSELKKTNKVFKDNEFKIGMPGRRKQALMLPLMGWAMSVKQSENATRILNQYVDANPNAILELVQDPLAMRLPEKYAKPLSNQYNDLLSRYGIPEEQIEEISDAMALAHIEAVNRIPTGDKILGLNSEAMTTLMFKEIDAESSLLKRLTELHKKQIDVLKNTFRKKIQELEIKVSNKNLLETEIEESFIGIGKIHDDLIQSAYGGLIERYYDLLRRSGAVQGNSASDILGEFRPNLKQLKNKNAALIYGDDFIENIAKIDDIIKSGRIDKYFEQSENKSPLIKLFQYLGDVTQRLESNGLLGGAPIPVTRNTGMNAITSPFMMMATTGATGLKTTLNALGINKQVPRTGQIMGMPDDAVAFTSDLGKQYTAAELKYLLSKYNTGFSQEEIILSTRKADQMLEDLDVYADGLLRDPKTSWLAKYVNPASRTIGTRFNIMVDQSLRDQTFFMALKSGKRPAEAATIAKRSVYNYGQVNPEIRKGLSKYLLFVSFQIENIKETANFMYKALKNDKPGALLGILRASMAKQREAETWFYTDDDAKTRMALPFLGKQKYQDVEYYQAGPRIPQLEVAKQTIDILSGLGGMLIGDKNSDQFNSNVSKIITNVQYRPSLKFGIDMIKNMNPNKDGMKVPDQWLYYLRASGGLQKGWFDDLIVPTETTKRRFNEPTYEEVRRGEDTSYSGAVQYRFRNNAAEQKFYAFLFVSTLLGQQRIMKEIADMRMAAGYDKDLRPALTVGTNYKAQEMLNPWLYMVGLTSKKEVNAAIKAYDRKLNYYIKRLESEKSSYESFER